MHARSSTESPDSGEVGRRPTKILLVTDSPVLPTGLAETARLIFGSLLAKYPGQYEIHQLALFHCYAVTAPQWPVYPTLTLKNRQGKLEFVPEDKYGQKSFPSLAARLQPDVVFGFGDPQTLLHLCRPAKERRYRLLLYINFDGLPTTPDFGPMLSQVDRIFTKSQFSMEVLARGLPMISRDKLDYRYSPADLERFAPAPANVKADMRRDLFPPWMPADAFVLGWVGRNQWRKQNWLLFKVLHHLRTGSYLLCRACGGVSLLDWEPTMQACRDAGILARESPPTWNGKECLRCASEGVERARPIEDLFLWCHMPEEPDEPWPARVLEQQFGLRRDRDLFYTPDHELKSALAPEDVPMLYRIWDGLLFLSGGEGFGLPAWEAMCSGLPVVYTNYSAHGEFLSRAKAGIGVGGILQPEPKTCIWRMVGDAAQAVQAVSTLYHNRNLSRELGANGRAFAAQFRIDAQADAWHQTFTSLIQDVIPSN